ncbi:MAG: hypothetical protein KGQ36_03455 [Rickettsiales bacterium]|nr:hypothetical protein [Rickettsiales bacterium]
MTKSYSKRLRKLTEQELVELEAQKESCCKDAVTSIKITQKTTAGDQLDLTKYLASGYVDQAFKYGWDEAVSDHQDEKNKTEDPSGKVYRNSILVKTASWFAIPCIVATIVSIAAPPAAPIAFGVAAVFGVIGAIRGVIDGYFESRTIKRAIELGKNSAQKEMSGIVNQTEKSAEIDKKIEDGIAKGLAKAAAQSGGVEQDKKSVAEKSELKAAVQATSLKDSNQAVRGA